MKRLILYLIRCKLGVKKHEPFRFANQRSLTEYYYFDKDAIIKVTPINGDEWLKQSRVSVNWILNDKCRIIKIGEK